MPNCNTSVTVGTFLRKGGKPVCYTSEGNQYVIPPRETSMLYLLRFLDDHTSRRQPDKRTSPMEVDTGALELTYVEILSLDFAENLIAAT